MRSVENAECSMFNAQCIAIAFFSEKVIKDLKESQPAIASQYR